MTTNLEQEMRALLDEEARRAPEPREIRPTLRQARRRQFGTVLSGVLGVAALVVAAIAGIRAVSPSDDGVPTVESTITSTVHGITITHPEDWAVVDPDEAGLNGPGPTPDLPRLVLAVAPFDPAGAFGCPGLMPDPSPTFLMTIEEEPLALTGESAAPWPARLESLGVGTDDSGCYPGWDLLQARWTASGRTFEALVGLAPDVSDADREALLAAFESMTFEEGEGAIAMQALLDGGVIGGETWELVVERGEGGMQLSVHTADQSTGIGGISTAGGEIEWAEQRIGEGPDERVLVFGPLPGDAVRLEVFEGDPPLSISILEVPEEISQGFDAFLVVMEPDLSVTLDALDDRGNVVGTARIFSGSHDPVETPPSGGLSPTPPEVDPVHGGTSWGLYLAVGRSPEYPELQTATQAAQFIGYTPTIGDLACDDDAATDLGLASDLSRVAIYFATREDAAAAAALFDPPPEGIARVTTYCLD